MARRHPMPKQGNAFSAGVAVAVLAAGYASPATAASDATVSCDDIADVNLEIASNEFQATAASHELDAKSTETSKTDSDMDAISPSRLLTPGVAATLRKVFKKPATPIADSQKPENDQTDSDEQPAMHTRVPGVSDDELARYKHQMYRTDI